MNKFKITRSTIFFIIVIVLAIGAVVSFVARGTGNGVPAGKYDTLATCLKDSGAKFYGAFWCSHCKAQKEAFGSAVKLLPYVECSNKDTSQTQVCQDAKIFGYPTWEFANEIKLESKVAPHKCTDATDESAICKSVYTPEIGTWIFDTIDMAIVKSFTDPTQNGTTWTFPVGSRLSGELSMEMLSKQTACPLPQ